MKEEGESGRRDAEDLSMRTTSGVRYRGRRGARENAGEPQKVYFTSLAHVDSCSETFLYWGRGEEV